MSEDDKRSRRPEIVPVKNGPLKVRGAVRLCNSRGEPIATPPTFILCRYGATKNKPFCDGTHVSIGFDDSPDPDRVPDRLDTYRGSQVVVSDNRGICSHAGFLYRQFAPGLAEWGRTGGSIQTARRLMTSFGSFGCVHREP